MKRLTYLLIFVASLGYSQSNLVFNQALLLTLSSSTTYTVPLGKVWKIEAPSLRGTNTSAWLILDGAPFNFAASNVGTITPIWLPEGTEVSYGIGSGSFENQPSNIVSILEFDVVPVSTTSTGSGGLSSEGLEFNQVINYSNNVTVGGYGEIIDVLEVPQGKVWKITRVTILGRSTGTSPGVQYLPTDVDQISVELGGINLFYRPTNSGYSNSSFENYPVWINSGTKDLVVGQYGGGSNRYRITLSAIEYNIPQ